MKNNQTLKKVYLRITPLKFIWRKMQNLRIRFFLRFNPQVIANRTYKSFFKKDINWDNPTDLIEKIYWLQIYSDTSLWTKYADKYLVRDFVKECGCGDTLNELYGVWYNPDHIDWSMLPESFVLKGNHSCGDVIIVKDKDKLNKNETTTQLKKWMKTVYGYYNAELHYAKIKPCIIAEKLLINKEDPDNSLVDYKIFCFHGVPECIIAVYNRTKERYSLSLYDLEWNDISEYAFNKKNRRVGEIKLNKPSSLDKMIDSAKKLSKNFPQVRVDFYDIDGQAVFGELTFSTGYPGFTQEYFNYLGSKIDLNKVDKLPKRNYVEIN